jgi:hypothetical protein
MKSVSTLFSIAVGAGLALGAVEARAAHCFCQLKCNAQIVNPHQYDDPLGSYTQLGNRESKACHKYCQGRLDQLQGTAAGSFFQNIASYSACSTKNTTTHKCTLVLSISDAVGTASYNNIGSDTFTANLTSSCPAGEQITWDDLKCGTLAAGFPPVPLPNQYIQPNYFIFNQHFYTITVPATQTCTP